MTEPNLLKIAYETWGTPSLNMNKKEQFVQMIGQLPEHNFAHYNVKSHEWEIAEVPYEEMKANPFRIYQHPSDKDVAGVHVLPGNAMEYDLSLIEKKNDELVQVDDADNFPLYRDESSGEKPDESDDEIINDLKKDLKAKNTDDIEPEIVDESSSSDESVDETVKRGKKRKAQLPPSENLLEQIEKQDLQQKIPEEHLTKEDYVIRWRILNALKWIKATPSSKFARLLNDRDPEFLKQNFDEMTYKELKNEWKKFEAIRSLNGIVCGTENFYNTIGQYASQGARQLGYYGPTNFMTDHLYEFRDDDVLNNIISHDPFKKTQINTFYHWFNILSPLAYYGWQMYDFHQKTEKLKELHNANASKQLTQDEINLYISLVPGLLL